MGRRKLTGRDVTVAVSGFVVGLILLLWWLSPRVMLPRESEQAISPSGPILIHFNRPLNPESIDDRFSVTPPVTGQLTVDKDLVVFYPDKPLSYRQRYTVILESGLRGSNGLPLLTRTAFTVSVRDPSLLFMREVDGVSNIWKREPSGEFRQLTFETISLWDYQVAPDGRGILYTSIAEDGRTRILLLKPDDSTEPILDCPDARCFSGQWQPGGSLVAFERNPLSTGMRPVTEVWLLETTTGQTRPVIDSRLAAEISNAGVYPRWSNDGAYLAFYQPDGRVVVIMDLAEGNTSLVPANLEIMSGWSPVENLLAFTMLDFGLQSGEKAPGVAVDEGALYRHLAIADATSEQATDITANQAVDYGQADWHPGGEFLAVPRGPQGGAGQIWTISPSGEELEQLTDDKLTNHSSVAWAPDGTRLAYMESPLGGVGDMPDIWILDVESGEKVLAAEDATLPAWLP